MTAIGHNLGAQPPTPAENQRGLVCRLDCGREVQVEEVRIALSALGYLAGSRDAIRAEVIKRLPDRVMDQFPRCDGFLIKPVPEGYLPRYPVSTRLNQVANDDGECSRRVEIADTQNRLFA